MGGSGRHASFYCLAAMGGIYAGSFLYYAFSLECQDMDSGCDILNRRQLRRMYLSKDHIIRVILVVVLRITHIAFTSP